METQNTKEESRELSFGDVLPDGWIVGPVSPETGLVMAIEPVMATDIEPVSRALGGRTWYQGQEHAAELRSQGNANARQPNDWELTSIYNSVVKAGRKAAPNYQAQFNSSHFYGEYWSSTTNPDDRDYALVLSFGSGSRYCWSYKGFDSVCVRCVRDEPGLKLV